MEDERTAASLRTLEYIDEEIGKRESASKALAERVGAVAARIRDVQRALDEKRSLLATAPPDNQEALREQIRAAEREEASLLRSRVDEHRAAELVMNALRRELEHFAVRRRAALGSVPEELANRYVALLAAGRRPALATIALGCCSGCHLTVPTMFEQALEVTARFQSCPHCRRILYRAREPRTGGRLASRARR